MFIMKTGKADSIRNLTQKSSKTFVDGERRRKCRDTDFVIQMMSDGVLDNDDK